MNIIGIDPGTIKTGISIITGTVKEPKFKTEIIGYDCESTMLPKIDQRLLYVGNGIQSVIRDQRPELVICEYPFGITGNAKVVIELFGIIRYFCLVDGYPFIPLQQARIKKYVTGSGRAEKSDMRLQAYKEYGLDLSEDKADAFWIAHMGMTYLYGSKKKGRQESIDAMKAGRKKKTKKVMPVHQGQ